jgi:hypothetical protein
MVIVDTGVLAGTGQLRRPLPSGHGHAQIGDDIVFGEDPAGAHMDLALAVAGDEHQADDFGRQRHQPQQEPEGAAEARGVGRDSDRPLF